MNTNNFNYFFTPVGPEYKKKFARNVGIAVLILFAFYGIWNLAVDTNDLFLSPIPESEDEKILNQFKNLPEVKAFYAKYEDANESVREDHVSYFTGSEDDILIRMNLYFDKTYELDHIDFHCYYQRTHLVEVSQEDIVYFLENRDCVKPDT